MQSLPCTVDATQRNHAYDKPQLLVSLLYRLAQSTECYLLAACMQAASKVTCSQLLAHHNRRQMQQQPAPRAHPPPHPPSKPNCQSNLKLSPSCQTLLLLSSSGLCLAWQSILHPSKHWTFTGVGCQQVSCLLQLNKIFNPAGQSRLCSNLLPHQWLYHSASRPAATAAFAAASAAAAATDDTADEDASAAAT